MPERTLKSSLPSAGPSPATTPLHGGQRAPSPLSSDSDIERVIREHQVDYGIITSGLCPTPDEQEFFDEHIAGRHPV